MTRLVIPVEVCPLDGHTVRANVLIDTGSEVNLMRKSLLPQSCFQLASAPGRFRAANQTLLPGGLLEAKVILRVRATNIENDKVSLLEIPITCYDADIGVDLIVSYEWLAKAGFDIVPREHGVMVLLNQKSFWIDGLRNPPPVQSISSVNVLQNEAITDTTEEYTVRDVFFREIANQFGLTPTLDCFATAGNTRCRRFISSSDEASRQPWPQDEVLWVNPPWSLWPEVESWVVEATNAAIVICPAWGKHWVRRLVALSSQRIYFEKGSRVFELDGKVAPGIPWGLWALKIDRGPRRVHDSTDSLFKCKIHPCWRPKVGWGKVEYREANLSIIGKEPKPTPPASDKIPPTKGRSCPKPKMLDLFSGTGSVSRVFEDHGFEVVSVDIAENFSPTIVTDILTWDYKAAFQPGYFDIIFCSPPCDHFSRARTTAPRDLDKADALVKKALEIILYFKPEKWFLENPRSGLLAGRSYMADIPYVDVDYCQFSDWGYQKPTRIWGDESILKIAPRKCDMQTCPNLCPRENGRLGHREILGGNQMRTTRLEKYRIPEALIRYLCGWPEPHVFESTVNFINSMKLDPLPELDVKFRNERFDESAAKQLALHLHQIGHADKFVSSVVVANNPYEGPEIEKLRATILEEYHDTVFADKHNREPPIRGPYGEATIELKPGVTPVKQRPFRMQGERYEAWKSLIDKLEEDGKIEDGEGPWNSPSFPVLTKTPGKWRLVDDFRRLNDATITDAHPMPIIEEILNKQSRCVIWTVLDMKDGYHQMPLKKEHRHLTCMSTPNGTKQWKVLVMGLKNGCAQFQKMMEWVCKPCPSADPYIDDVIIGSQGDTPEEAIQNHLRDLRQVLDRLREVQLLVNPRKAKLFMREVEFCGHVLSEGKRRPAPGKLLSIQKWELPQTVTQLRGFLGLTNYYSSYVPHYAEYAGPLMSKLQLNRIDGKKGSQKKLVWRKTEIEAFEKLKEVLASNLELFRIDPDSPFILRTDASDRAIGAVLEQDRVLVPGEPPKRVPVGFFSRKLGKSQLNWPPREKETYAIVSALRKWSSWVGLQPILILTDHKSLENWVTEKMDTPSGPAGRRARWHETLSKFDLTVQYVPGPENVVADALSRFAYPASKAFQDSSFHGGEEAREEMRRIIEEELAESRNVGLVFLNDPDPCQRIAFVAGTMPRAKFEKLSQVTPSTIYHIEMSSHPPVSKLNPDATPFHPIPLREVDGMEVTKLTPDEASSSSAVLPTSTSSHDDFLFDRSGRTSFPREHRRSRSSPPSLGSDVHTGDPPVPPFDPLKLGHEQVNRPSLGNKASPDSYLPYSLLHDPEKSDIEPEIYVHNPYYYDKFGFSDEDFSDERFCDVDAIENEPPRRSPRLHPSSEEVPPAASSSAPTIFKGPKPRELIADSWEKDYLKSDWWGKEWRDAHSVDEFGNEIVRTSDKWPDGIRIAGNRMIADGLIAVPEKRVVQVIKDLHVTLNHLGTQKLLKEMTRRYNVPPKINLPEECKKVKQACPICQACDPPFWSMEFPMDFTPIPPHVMSSVAIDDLSVEPVTWRGKKYDSVFICVDRLSGWIIARPHTKVGFTAESAAHDMLENGWEVFGIPSVITSDQAPQFIGQWWKTMCARLGVRVAYSQAYRAQANGRAEAAVKVIIEAIRKRAAEKNGNWVEVLPRILWNYHNIPGESGLSPFQIVFGRDRHEAGIPYEIVQECEGANQFFDRMETLDNWVAKQLETIHRQRLRVINASRTAPTPYKVGDWVWALRPRSSPQTGKLDTRWVGPVKVLKRVGDMSYVVGIKPNKTFDVHASHLKPCYEGEYKDKLLDLYYFPSTHEEMGLAPDEWNVKDILRHRTKPDGTLEFLTHWEGYPAEEATWEPADHFIPRYCYEWVQYCQKKGIKVDIIKYLKPTPSV